MNAFTLTTPDTSRFPLGERWVSPGQRFRVASVFGAIAALGIFAVATTESSDAAPQSCPYVSQAWPSDADSRSSAWPAESTSVDMFALTPAGFGLPGESSSTDMLAASRDNAGACL